jgi:hypothetical protein
MYQFDSDTEKYTLMVVCEANIVSRRPLQFRVILVDSTNEGNFLIMIFNLITGIDYVIA